MNNENDSINFEQYIKEALKTESCDLEKIASKFFDTRNIRLLHAIIGISTESGELLDALKKFIFYDKPLDLVNLEEEIGDLFWYVAILIDCINSFDLNVSLSDILDTNVAKLKKRYGGKFSNEKANNRDLDGERTALDREYQEAKKRKLIAEVELLQIANKRRVTKYWRGNI